MSQISNHIYFGFYPQQNYYAKQELVISNIPTITSLPRLMSSIVFDIESKDIKLKVAQDGLIMIGFKKQLSSRHIVQYINCLFVLLQSRALEATLDKFFVLNEQTLADIVVLKYNDNNLTEVSTEGVSEMTNYAYSGRFLTSYIRINPAQIDFTPDGFWDKLYRANITNDPRILQRQDRVLQQQTFEQVLQDIERINTDHYMIQIVASVSKICEQINQANYAEALIFAWFVIEAYLYKLYTEKVSTASSSTKEHEDSISSAVLIRELKQAKVLSHDVGNDLHTIRIARNDAVHNTFDSEVTRTDALMALEAIKQFIARDTGINLGQLI
jgi:Domain of unknown function (DUF4145)